MRLRAMRDLGWSTVIGKLNPEGTSAEKLNEYILLDNANFGKWDFDALANEWEAELLADMNIDVPKISKVIGEDAYTSCDLLLNLYL